MDWKHPAAAMRTTILHGTPACHLCIHRHRHPKHQHTSKDGYFCCFWGKKYEEIGPAAYRRANKDAGLTHSFSEHSCCTEFDDGLETS